MRDQADSFTGEIECLQPEAINIYMYMYKKVFI